MGPNSQHVSLIQIRLKCKDADRGSIHVKSTFDKTEKMEHRTDESISFTDDDLVVIKNCRESASAITLETIRLPLERRIVCQPSRHGTFTLVHKDVSQVHFSRTFELQGGESLVLKSSAWKPNRLRGNYSGPM